MASSVPTSLNGLAIWRGRFSFDSLPKSSQGLTEHPDVVVPFTGNCVYPLRVIPCMLALLFAGVALQSAPPAYLPSEVQALPEIQRLGGHVQWVMENHKWELSLDFNGPVKDLDLVPVKNLSRLYALRVMDGTIKEASLRSLSELPDLHLLVVLAPITDDGLAAISGLRHLDKIDVTGDLITGRGLAKMKALKDLRRLYLYRTKIRDADTAPLRDFKRLTVLDLPDTVSTQATNRLKAALPNTEIRRMGKSG